MDEAKIETEKREYTGRFRFFILITSAITIACLLVLLSLKLYDWSGASQLDFSLPSYNGMRQEIDKDTSINFPSTGAIDQATIDQFNEQYDIQLEHAQKSTGFGSKALSDSSLGIKMPKD